MRPYEMVLLLHPDLEIDLDKPLKKIESLVKDQQGKLTKTDVWGKRKLAYPIRKEDFAVYVYYELELPPAALKKLEGMLNITDEVVRYLISHPVPVIEEEPEDESDTDESKDKSTAKAGKEA